MLVTLLLAAQILTVEPDGARLAETEQCFTLYRDTEQGDVAIGNTWQTVQRIEYEGKTALRIVVHQFGSGGSFDMRDEFVLDARNLKPLELHNQFKSSSGAAHAVDLRYAADRITGTRTTDGKIKSVDISLDHAVWEGNLWGLTFATLPLQKGAHFELPFWQYDKGFGVFDVEVTEEKYVTTPEGKADAWVLDAGIKDGPHSEYLIAKDGRKELGYGSEGFRQVLGGDCTQLK